MSMFLFAILASNIVVHAYLSAHIYKRFFEKFHLINGEKSMVYIH